MLIEDYKADRLICPMMSSPSGIVNCAGVRCPVWRWYDKVFTTPASARTSDRGYCGLGGKPHTSNLKEVR